MERTYEDSFVTDGLALAERLRTNRLPVPRIEPDLPAKRTDIRHALHADHPEWFVNPDEPELQP